MDKNKSCQWWNPWCKVKKFVAKKEAKKLNKKENKKTK